MASAPVGVTELGPQRADHWKAFIAIAISFVTMVFSMTMVFVALAAMADHYGVTLRAISWVVIVQSLVISALMMPLGRVADMVGRRRVHLGGLVLFAFGSVGVAFAPTFALMLVGRVVMSFGNAMTQAVGTAMVVAVFPPDQRGKALGSQTSVVAIGAAMGPIGAGLVLQVLPWQALFLMLIPPLVVAYVAGYKLLDEAQVSASGDAPSGPRPAFDWGGAALSALAITAMVLTVSNPFALAWTSPAMVAGAVVIVVLFATFVRWELRQDAPMLELRFFAVPTFSMAVTSRTLGFVGYTAVSFLMPIFLISVRGLREGATGAVLFLASLGMGLAANQSGRYSDRFGERPVFLVGFALNAASLAGIAMLGRTTPLALAMVLLFANGLALGLWNVPNGSAILASVPAQHLGVVGAFMNLTRNIGNVVGQALAAAIVVGVMTARGLDVPLSEIASTAGAAEAFLHGWRVSYGVVTALAVVSLALAVVTRPAAARSAEGG
ncbi:MAG: MFS transporter [Acidimicrobiia bacterium]|nr:MFS transporter [Acidimicrobiia bacterium]